MIAFQLSEVSNILSAGAVENALKALHGGDGAQRGGCSPGRVLACLVIELTIRQRLPWRAARSTLASGPR